MDLSGTAARHVLEACLATWLPEQRWFAGKARTLTSVAVVDEIDLKEDIVDHLVIVSYADGGAEEYQVPLVRVTDAQPGDLHLDTGWVLRDAVRHPDACRLLAGLTMRRAEVRSTEGAAVVAHPVDPDHHLPDDVDVRLMTAEQSNSSIVLGGECIFKLFRRLEAGVNPDMELTRGLTEEGFPHIPAQIGAAELHRGPGEVFALGVTSDFIAGAREGWDLAWRDAAAVAGGSEPGLGDAAGELGAVVARMHCALSDRFGAETAGAAETTAWADAWCARAQSVLRVAQERAPEATAPVLERREELLAALAAVAGVSDPGPLIRVHGDLHLGQTLRSSNGRWYVLDFEGEPARTLAERQAPGPPARDVSGMLRSFGYAEAQGARSAGQGERTSALAGWTHDMRARFLAGYCEDAAALLPQGDEERAALLRAFEIDKATYELGYELANRPGWVTIPVVGILNLLDETHTRPEGTTS